MKGKMKKTVMKKFVAICMVCVMGIGISACGAGTGEEPQTSGEEAALEEPQANGEKKELSLWHYWDAEGMQGAVARLADDYEQETGVKINVTYVPYTEYTQKLLVSATGGDIPDLLFFGGNETATYVEAGILADITDKIEASGTMDNSFEGVIEEHKVGDSLYGLPLYANCLALFYNKDIVQTPPETLSELYETAKAVTKDEMYGFAMSGIAGEESSFQFLPFVWSAKEDMNTINGPGTVQALDTLAKMIEEGIMTKDVVNYTQQDVRIAFETGRAAMMINGPWQVPSLTENVPDMDWGVAMIPKVDGGEFASVLGGESFGVGKGSDIDGAWEFVDFLMEAERYGELLRDIGQLPADKETAQDSYYQDDPVRKLFVEQLECARPRLVSPKYNEMSKALQTAIGGALSGSVGAQEALDQAAEIIVPLYEEFQNSK